LLSGVKKPKFKRIHMSLSIHKCIHMSLNIYKHIYMLLNIYKHIHMSLSIHKHIHMSLNMHTHIHMSVNIYTHIHMSLNIHKCRGPGDSMSWVVGSNNSYKPITNTAWVRAQLCKLQKRVHSTHSRK
jgi:hypothetical protein